MRRLLAALPIFAGFAVFGTVVLLAYEDASRGPPIGEPPLIKAAADPIKLPPEEAEESTLEEEGTVGRLWSDAEQADQPERLLPPPEEPLAPPAVEDAPAETAVARSADPTEAGSTEAPAEELAARDVTTAASPDTAAPADPEDGSLEEAEAALDRLLAEVTALSEEGSAAPTAAAPASEAQDQAISRAEPPAAATRGGAAAPVSSSVDPPAQTPPSAEPAATPRTSAEVRPASASARERTATSRPPPAEPTETAAVEDTAVPISPPAVAADGDFRIQLAAVREEVDARRAWDLFMIDLGPVLRELVPIFERAETANGVFYRVQIGPFATQQAAESLCEELKQRNASCFVIRR